MHLNGPEEPDTSMGPDTAGVPKKLKQALKNQTLKDQANREKALGQQALREIAMNRAKKVGRRINKNKGKIIRGFARGTSRFVAAGAGAAIGLAAGLTTGDLSKTATFMSTGALATSTMGGKAYDLAENSAKGGYNNFLKGSREEYEELMYGKAEADKRHNDRIKKKMMKDPDQIEKYKQMKKEIGYNGDVKDLIAASADLQMAGVTDENLIKNTLSAENRMYNGEVGGKGHEDLAKIAYNLQKNKLGENDIYEGKNLQKLDNSIAANSNLNDLQRREVGLLSSEILAGKNGRAYYDAHGKFGKNTNSQTQTPKTKPEKKAKK